MQKEEDQWRKEVDWLESMLIKTKPTMDLVSSSPISPMQIIMGRHLPMAQELGRTYDTDAPVMLI